MYKIKQSTVAFVGDAAKNSTIIANILITVSGGTIIGSHSGVNRSFVVLVVCIFLWICIKIAVVIVKVCSFYYDPVQYVEVLKGQLFRLNENSYNLLVLLSTIFTFLPVFYFSLSLIILHSYLKYKGITTFQCLAEMEKKKKV